jgi:hypothetical protein
MGSTAKRRPVITPRDGLHGHLVIVKFLFFILFEMTFNNGVASFFDPNPPMS